MLGRAYNDQCCSIAGALESIGERWTLLIIRDAFLGVRRFDDFQRGLGIARNILTARLALLVEQGILKRVRYQERPERFEYRLTEKGIDLWPMLVALLQWGDRHVYPGDPPVVITHRGCGGDVTDHRTCASCGAELGPHDITAVRRRDEHDRRAHGEHDRLAPAPA
jgi:DNA-binding HxlR family transcriptional regulator